MVQKNYEAISYVSFFSLPLSQLITEIGELRTPWKGKVRCNSTELRNSQSAVSKKTTQGQKPMVRQCTAYSGNLIVKLTWNDVYRGKPEETPKATCSSDTWSTRKMKSGLYGKTPESTRLIYVTI